jgi:hypothetical protein
MIRNLAVRLTLESCRAVELGTLIFSPKYKNRAKCTILEVYRAFICAISHICIKKCGPTLVPPSYRLYYQFLEIINLEFLDLGFSPPSRKPKFTVT